MSEDDSGYRFQEVEFKTLRDINPVKGDLDVKGGAVLSVDNDIGEVIASSDPDAVYSKKGAGVSIDYVLDGDVIYPKDFTSMAALAIYYNFERTFLYWQNYNNLSLEDFGYTTIYNNPILQGEGSGTSIEVEVKVNAAFLSGVRDLWFFKKSRLAIVPIKMNFGVMAHSFHSMFDFLVANKEPSFYEGNVINKDDLQPSMRLSDFFELVTGRKNELGQSLASLADERIPGSVD